MNGVGWVILGLVAGAAFILLGRWIYASPYRVLYIRSLFVDPDSSFLRTGAKTIGTFFIVAGSCAAVVAPASRAIPNSAAWLIVPLGAAVLGAWFLRPRVVEAPRAATEPPVAGHGRVLTRKGKLAFAWTLIVCAGLTATIAAPFWTRGSGNKVIPIIAMVAALVMVFALASLFLT